MHVFSMERGLGAVRAEEQIHVPPSKSQPPWPGPLRLLGLQGQECKYFACYR
jgi:hypothetical protein